MAEVRSKGRVMAKMTGSMAEQIRELHEGAKRALRPAAHAGALTFYNEMRVRVPVDEGTLRDSVYRFHVDKKSGETRHVYQIGPNTKKAPHWHLLEYGHWRVNVVIRGADGKFIATTERLASPVWVPAVPYIRPTFDAMARAATQAMKTRYASALRETETGWQ